MNGVDFSTQLLPMKTLQHVYANIQNLNKQKMQYSCLTFSGISLKIKQEKLSP